MRYEFGDPAKVLEINEAKTCKGCKNSVLIFGLQHCENPRSDGVRIYKKYGGKIRRCKDFEGE